MKFSLPDRIVTKSLLLLVACGLLSTACNSQQLKKEGTADTVMLRSADSIAVTLPAEPTTYFARRLTTLEQQIEVFAHKLDSVEQLSNADPADTVLLKIEELSRKQLEQKIQEKKQLLLKEKEHAKSHLFSMRAYSPEGRQFTVLVANLDSVEIDFYLKDQEGANYGNFMPILKEEEEAGKRLLFATNGGMYMPDGSPQGLYIEEGKELNKLDKKEKGYGNFYLQPNGVFFVRKNNSAGVLTTQAYQSVKQKVQFATQSGPMLVVDGAISSVLGPNSPNFHIRNGVGVDQKGRVVFIISNERVRFYELAELFQQLGCNQALYLDGAISQTYLPTEGMTQRGGGFGVIIGLKKKM